jgi:hypothetical protein
MPQATRFLKVVGIEPYQTLLATAKLNGLDPAAWLKDTLEKLPTWPNSRIEELLPFATLD